MRVSPASSRRLRTPSKVRLLRSMSGLTVTAHPYRQSDDLSMMGIAAPRSFAQPWIGCAHLVSVGAIDRIYVHSPDRLARNYAYQVLLLDEWRRRGVELVFLNRPLGQSPEDDLLLQVQGIVAEYERAKIMERSRRGKKHAAQSGSLNVMSGAPFGYRYVSVREGGGQARFEAFADQDEERTPDCGQPVGAQGNLGEATRQRQPPKKNGCLLPFPPWSTKRSVAQHTRNSRKTEVAVVKGVVGPGICCRGSLAARNADMPITARRSAN